jgi:hypothetical protein
MTRLNGQLNRQGQIKPFRPREADIHTLVVRHIKRVYPHLIFRTDFAAGMKLSIPQSRKHASLQSGRAYPDLFIAEPCHGKAGLFLELKKDDTAVVLRNGELTANPHIREQAVMLERLNKKGYVATFAIGYEDAVAKIASYLSGGEVQTYQPAPIEPKSHNKPFATRDTDISDIIINL